MKKMKLRFQTKSKLDSRVSYFSDDNLMDVSQKQFLKQQEQLFDLQANLRIFIKGIMDITNTIDNMYSSFKSIYEPNWIGNVEFNHMCQESVKIWRQFITDFRCNISKSIDDYGQEFPEIKRSIEKRNKRLSELNKQRLIYENYRNAKKIDEIKLKKAEMEMHAMEQEYLSQNNSLKEKLPQFCDKRIRVYLTLWTKLFEAEEAMFSFLQEGRKYQLGILSKLSDAADTGQYNIRSQVTTINGNDSNLLSTKAYAQSAMTLVNPEHRATLALPFEHGSLSDINSPNQKPPHVQPALEDSSEFNRTKSYQVNARVPSEISNNSNTSFFSIPQDRVVIKKRISFTEKSQVQTVPVEKVIPSNHTQVTANPVSVSVIEPDTSDVDVDAEEYDYVDGTKNNNVKRQIVNEPVILDNQYDDDVRKNLTYQVLQEIDSYYQVTAEFDYDGQDEDELDLKRDDVILVLPWDSEEQMEDGWLYGENIITKQKGLFPENHTIRLQS